MRKQAGAEAFEEFGTGTNARQVFRELVQEAQYEYGSRGYTGSIAEKDGFVMATRQVMTKAQAEEFVNREINRYGKWDDAGCIAIGEEKIVASKDFEIIVKAKDRKEATKLAREKMMGGRKRAGAIVEVQISWQDVNMTTPAGKRKLTTHKATNEVVFMIFHSNGEPWGKKTYGTKREAVAKLKELINDPYWDWKENEVFTIRQVKSVGGISYQESSRLPTFTVSGKRVQKKLGKVRGFYFFGYASS